MFDAKRFLEVYQIPFWTNGKNVSPGWVNIQCVCCNDQSNHGGWSPTGMYNCWRCGSHNTEYVLELLLNCTETQAIKIIKEFQTETTATTQRKKLNNAHTCILPNGTMELQKKHRLYLKKRNFDPDKIIDIWKIKATNYIGDYKFRIIIPIYLDSVLVSYQGRDYTGQQELRYKTCATENEVVHHKHMLYGTDQAPGDRCVLVEGITDVWRLGPGAVCSFGTSITNRQLLFIQQHWKTVFIMLDPDAMDKAEKICTELECLGVESFLVQLPGQTDPADYFTDEEAKKIMEELLCKKK